MRQKHRFFLITSALLMFAFSPIINFASTDHVKLILNTNTLFHNGSEYSATSPHVVKNGVTYISMRALGNRLGLNVTYLAESKTMVLASAKVTLTFQPGNANYTVNGVRHSLGTSVPYVENDTLMVPLRVFANHFGVTVTPELKENTIHLNWSNKPSAAFEVSPSAIYAEQTRVTYKDLHQTPNGDALMSDLWENKQTIFTTPGEHTIERIVQSSDGTWSDLYTVTINVLPPNQAPVANFITNKSVYKLGEPIVYTDRSKDDENAITSAVWTNNRGAFFESGEHEITLEVTDKHGLKDRITKTITVSQEVLYTQDAYNRLFVPTGDKFAIRGNIVPSFPAIKYTPEVVDDYLFRSNNPEKILSDGIYYEDLVSGTIRVSMHHQNHKESPVKFYLAATNPSEEPITIKVPHVGIGGPHIYVTLTGKNGVARYLESLITPNQETIVLEPGETKIIVPEMSIRNVQSKQTLTLYAAVITEEPILLQSIVLDSEKDFYLEHPSLKVLTREPVHARGTYVHGSRYIHITERIGDQTQRLVFGDRNEDVKVSGVDATTGLEVSNFGNYGVLYKINLHRVAPNTLITLNSRGGHYSGAFMVNGKIIMTTANSHLLDANESAVLYRTGSKEEHVEISFIPASGSTLPIHFIFEQMPEKRK